jgi:hypothetical protein
MKVGQSSPNDIEPSLFFLVFAIHPASFKKEIKMKWKRGLKKMSILIHIKIMI